jgi:hypothetical protein
LKVRDLTSKEVVELDSVDPERAGQLNPFGPTSPLAEEIVLSDKAKHRTITE